MEHLATSQCAGSCVLCPRFICRQLGSNVAVGQLPVRDSILGEGGGLVLASWTT